MTLTLEITPELEQALNKCRKELRHLMEEARATPEELAGWVAMFDARRALYRNAEADLREALEYETFAQNACFETEDAREGIRAFVDKRTPIFRGR